MTWSLQSKYPLPPVLKYTEPDKVTVKVTNFIYLLEGILPSKFVLMVETS